MSTDEQLAKRALAVRKNAYNRYSGFSVGAALLDNKGNVYAGCNVENASYPQGSCAETGAIAAMIAGGGGTIKTIVVAGGSGEVSTCTPCGGCRQRIAEFADAETRILVLNDEKSWQSYSIAELLPASFRLG
ncbi:MAG TPA: cytidine deaminase [Woeseiaceae bacterium]|nr:cytidine deaminase [Woeseiaceae bacterium]